MVLAQRMLGLEFDRAGAYQSVEAAGGPRHPWEHRGPDLASFDSSQLTGEPPYLVEVLINADLSVTIQQQTSLPEKPVVKYC